MDDLRSLFRRKLEETREALRRHQQLERELLDGLEYLETCRVCATPAAVTGCASCQQDHGMKAEPALVAGIITPPGTARRGRGTGFVAVNEIRSASRARTSPASDGKEERR